MAEGEAEGDVEAVLGAVRAQQADVLAAAQAEGVGRSDWAIAYDVSELIWHHISFSQHIFPLDELPFQQS